MTDQEWRNILSTEEFRILRTSGTEAAFTHSYDKKKDFGVYYCAGCGQPLYSSQDKYDSGTGWPSFGKPVTDGALVLTPGTIAKCSLSKLRHYNKISECTVLD